MTDITIICPHCGNVQTDSISLYQGEDNAEIIFCSSCEKRFVVTVELQVVNHAQYTIGSEALQ